MISNALSVDVEDYFQVTALSERVARSEWERLPARVERNTDAVLELFAESGAKATFFVLGWVAERHPALVRRIAEDGHEIASHGYEHVRATLQDPGQFRADVGKTKRILEDVSGQEIRGYRAASFSLTPAMTWAYESLFDCGYRYSSSVYPISHDLYGSPEALVTPYHPLTGRDFWEIPVSALGLAGRRLPCGGGGYFRLLPYLYSAWALDHINRREGRPCVFYFHPWEIDPDQPRVAALSLKSRLRHYTNLRLMKGKLRRLLRDFDWDRLDRVFLSERGAEVPQALAPCAIQ
jgi:polysaccharide deacetylase family protein (PEP-CTERM system associated)